MPRIYEIRGEVRRRDARPNDGRCGNVSAALETEFGWPGQSGYLKLLDSTVSWIHCWNRLADGTIVDATADQFQDLWLDDIVILDADNRLVANYRNAPREWEIHFDNKRANRIRCASGDDIEVLSSKDSCPWLSLARMVLKVITGWELNEHLTDLAARTLRAKSSAADLMSSAELTHVLLIDSIQHLGRGESPWIAAEFREPL